MATRNLNLPISGFTQGLNTEASVLSILPSEFMAGSINVELKSNGVLRRRRGVDWIGQSDTGLYLHSLRTNPTSSEVLQDSPSAITVDLPAPNGTVIKRTILALDGGFRVYDHTFDGIRNLNLPLQIIDPGVGSNVGSNQRYEPIRLVESSGRVYFSGKHLQHGYLKVSSDNSSLDIVYLDGYVRDTAATGASSRIRTTDPVSGAEVWLEAIKGHIADSTNQPLVGVDWQRYWQRLDTAVNPSVPVWSSGTSYVSAYINLFDTDTNINNTSIRSSVLGFFAGRLWLALDNILYFSQVVRDESDIYNDLTRLHAFADPFNSDDPDPVDDDGGQITITGASKILDIIEFNDSLFVATNTGVKQIAGRDGIFKATDFSQYSVLQDPCLSSRVFAVGDERLYVYTQNNIWRSGSTDLSSGTKLTFEPVADKKIQTLYSNIPQNAKASAYPLYNPSERRVYYFFNDILTTYDLSYNPNNTPGYSKNILVYDTRSPDTDSQGISRNTGGSFFLYELNDTAHEEKPYIAHAFIAPAVNNINDNVIVGSDNVVDGVDNVVVGSPNKANDKSSIILVGLRRQLDVGSTTIQVGFAKLEGDVVKDWSSDTTYKTSFDSKAILGTQTGGNVIVKKHPTYIFLVFKKVETGVLIDGVDTNQGGCLMRVATQFAVDSTSAKYGQAKPVYFPDRLGMSIAGDGNDGHDHTWFKHRVRGRGNVFQFILENDGDKDFELIGWVNQFHGGTD